MWPPALFVSSLTAPLTRLVRTQAPSIPDYDNVVLYIFKAVVLQVFLFLDLSFYFQDDFLLRLPSCGRNIIILPHMHWALCLGG